VRHAHRPGARRGLALALVVLSIITAGCCRRRSHHRLQVQQLAAVQPLTGTVYALVATGSTDGVTLGDVRSALARVDSPAATPWTVLPAPVPLLAVEVDPFQASSVFAVGIEWTATAAESFVLRSDDRGATWTRLLTGLPAASATEYVRSLHVDTRVADRVWVGYRAVTGDVLFRSDDRGATWAPAGAGITSSTSSTTDVTGVADDASDPGLRYALTQEGVFRTLNAGAAWTSFAAGLPAGHVPFFVAADPSIAGRAYLLAYGPVQAGLFRSDGGGAWTELPAAAALQGGGPDATTLLPAFAVDPTQPLRLYLGVFQRGLFVSDDGGVSWSPLDGRSFQPSPEVSLASTSPLQVIVDAGAPTRVMVLAERPVVTDDGGLTWRGLDTAGLPLFTSKSSTCAPIDF
jgi:photosystem II stability/assembly factor-like uncharacterized protein